MRLLSHRGFHVGTEFHENTVAAFEKAVELGVDGIETDIRLSSDDRLVLYRDRIDPHGRAVAEITRAELEQATQYPVATLAEALRRWPRLYWNLEIKTLPAAEPVIQLLESHGEPGNVLISSFRHDVVALCADRLAADCALLIAHRPLSLESLLAPWRGRDRMRFLVWDFDVLDPVMAEESRRLGYGNLAYGVVSQAEYSDSRSMGLAGIITDFPGLARASDRRPRPSGVLRDPAHLEE